MFTYPDNQFCFKDSGDTVICLVLGNIILVNIKDFS